MRVIAIVGAAVGLLAVPVLFFWPMDPASRYDRSARAYEYGYRIHLEVRDGEGIHTATNVVRVREGHRDDGPVAAKQCGEATFVRLSSGNYLFALLNGPPIGPTPDRYLWRDAPTGLLLQRLGLETEWSWKDDSGIRKLPANRTAIALDPDQMPELVAFRNINDPTTIERISPDRIPDWLGQDANVGITISVTGEHETKGRLGRVLPWFNPASNYLDGTHRGKAAQFFRSQQFSRCF